jgi:hypothetical protein
MAHGTAHLTHPPAGRGGWQAAPGGRFIASRAFNQPAKPRNVLPRQNGKPARDHRAGQPSPVSMVFRVAIFLAVRVAIFLKGMPLLGRIAGPAQARLCHLPQPVAPDAAGTTSAFDTSPVVVSGPTNADARCLEPMPSKPLGGGRWSSVNGPAVFQPWFSSTG